MFNNKSSKEPSLLNLSLFAKETHVCSSTQACLSRSKLFNPSAKQASCLEVLSHQTHCTLTKLILTLLSTAQPHLINMSHFQPQITQALTGYRGTCPSVFLLCPNISTKLRWFCLSAVFTTVPLPKSHQSIPSTSLTWTITSALMFLVALFHTVYNLLFCLIHTQNE